MNLQALIGLFLFTLRRINAGKRSYAALAILSVAPFCELLICSLPRHVQATYFYDITYEMGCHLEPLLLALVYALALTTSEIEDGTAGYVMLAALPRSVVALVQVVATGVGLTVLLGGSIGATCLADVAVLHRTHPDALPPIVDVVECALVAGASVTAYLSVFSLCGHAFRRGIAVSIGIAVIWEAIVAQMPIRATWYTVTNNVRALLDRAVSEQWGGAIGYPDWIMEERPTAWAAGAFLVAVTVLALLLGMRAASRRALARGEAG